MERKSSMESLATLEHKRLILEKLRQESRFQEPFDEGDVALSAIGPFGERSDDYALVVVNMVIADTLINIEGRLTEMMEVLRKS